MKIHEDAFPDSNPIGVAIAPHSLAGSVVSARTMDEPNVTQVSARARGDRSSCSSTMNSWPCGFNDEVRRTFHEAITTMACSDPSGTGGLAGEQRVLLSHVPSASEISVSSSAAASVSCQDGRDCDECNLCSDASASDEGMITSSSSHGSLHKHQGGDSSSCAHVRGSRIRPEDSGPESTESRVPPAHHHGARKRKLGASLPAASKQKSFPDSTRKDPIKKRRVNLSLLTFESLSPLGSKSVASSPPLSPVLPATIQLLAQPEDEQALSPLHAFIRQQIEVFCATRHDVEMPCPGRKIAIQEHQVGLRCVHCRHLSGRGRVKRATCYPTSVSRIYSSVNDMKFDHFRSCPHVPADVRAAFEALKEEDHDRGASGGGHYRPRRRSSCASGLILPSSTAQYYHDSARRMGMVDGQQRIYLIGLLAAASSTGAGSSTGSNVAISTDTAQVKLVDSRESGALETPTFLDLTIKNVPNLDLHLFPNCKPLQLCAVTPTETNETSLVESTGLTGDGPPETQKASALEGSGAGSILMAQPNDSHHLNPLHCFVRQRIEFFSATPQDVTNPCPGRKTRVQLGQVGVRCTRCSHLPLRERIKRSACFPPTIKGVYHAVSNMKYDHFSACRGLTSQERDEFDSLREVVTNRRGSDSSDGTLLRKPAFMSSSATSRFYVQSAIRLGLVDTANGIRFQKSPISDDGPGAPDLVDTPVCDQPATTRREPVGMTALMLAATDPELRKAFEKSKAV